MSDNRPEEEIANGKGYREGRYRVMRDYGGEEEDYAERESFVEQLDAITVILLVLVAIGLLLTVAAQIGMALGRMA